MSDLSDSLRVLGDGCLALADKVEKFDLDFDDKPISKFYAEYLEPLMTAAYTAEEHAE